MLLQVLCKGMKVMTDDDKLTFYFITLTEQCSESIEGGGKEAADKYEEKILGQLIVWRIF